MVSFQEESEVVFKLKWESKTHNFCLLLFLLLSPPIPPGLHLTYFSLALASRLRFPGFIKASLSLCRIITIPYYRERKIEREGRKETWQPAERHGRDPNFAYLQKNFSCFDLSIGDIF